jgi:phosphatidylserine/phosphatidylglycerophosphate/cardiolipin synthase-like enzyme
MTGRFATREILKGSESGFRSCPKAATSSPGSSRTGRTAILKRRAGRCWPRWPRRKRPCTLSRRIFCRIRRSSSALNLAALRGVRVDIILPAKNNLPFVHWASRAMWWQVLERGCHLWLTPPPFDHSKLMIVDGHWVLFGSANWDARSLRLNFELNVECYGREFAQRMESVIEQKLRPAREVTLAETDGRMFAPRLRDAIARLFSPYL